MLDFILLLIFYNSININQKSFNMFLLMIFQLNLLIIFFFLQSNYFYVNKMLWNTISVVKVQYYFLIC